MSDENVFVLQDWKDQYIPWMFHVNYARGFAYILGIWHILLRLAIWIFSGTYLRCYEDRK